MTVYCAFSAPSSGSSGQRLTLQAGAYELRLISAFCSYGVDLQRWSGATVSGGSTVPFFPFQQGAPAASAVARWGSVSVTGGTRTDFEPFFANTLFTPAADLTVAPGSVLAMTLTVSPSQEFRISFTFEELLLAWHY